MQNLLSYSFLQNDCVIRQHKYWKAELWMAEAIELIRHFKLWGLVGGWCDLVFMFSNLKKVWTILFLISSYQNIIFIKTKPIFHVSNLKKNIFYFFNLKNFNTLTSKIFSIYFWPNLDPKSMTFFHLVNFRHPLQRFSATFKSPSSHLSRLDKG